MKGPGKYDPDALRVLHATQARGVLLVVIGGGAGSGFSVCFRDAALLHTMPDALRHMATAIEQDLASGAVVVGLTDEDEAS